MIGWDYFLLRLVFVLWRWEQWISTEFQWKSYLVDFTTTTLRISDLKLLCNLDLLTKFLLNFLKYIGKIRRKLLLFCYKIWKKYNFNLCRCSRLSPLNSIPMMSFLVYTLRESSISWVVRGKSLLSKRWSSIVVLQKCICCWDKTKNTRMTIKNFWPFPKRYSFLAPLSEEKTTLVVDSSISWNSYSIFRNACLEASLYFCT